MTVKFKGNIEPCIIYRVSPNFPPDIRHNNFLKKNCEHIFLEVIGYTPTELVEEIVGHPNNTYALDYKLHQDNRAT